jgi:hypothetical protein
MERHGLCVFENTNEENVLRPITGNKAITRKSLLLHTVQFLGFPTSNSALPVECCHHVPYETSHPHEWGQCHNLIGIGLRSVLTTATGAGPDPAAPDK